MHRENDTVEDPEAPFEELLRNAREISQDLYFIRSDAAYRIPYGVMLRMKAAIARCDESMIRDKKE